ncbi:hypothetical protein F3H86_05075 [Aeromonas veronii]|nr:hypothetical protein [Aeromonas veronii]MBE8742640.1 hypothetical protein [Aeromonas veronii]MBE8762567.1 hypothetical protein [Aeromonas veronii]MBE8838189.1 hypothetical protein [Aeromonas veronii]
MVLPSISVLIGCIPLQRVPDTHGSNQATQSRSLHFAKENNNLINQRDKHREQGAGSREQGAGSREQGAGSREQGAG